MQITDLYQTKIECSTYNANIDSTDTVITVSLIDFNGNAVTGKSVTLTCDKGYFNKKGSTAISGTTTKSITLNTDSNGQITGTWTASEWGLATFSANSSNMQITVNGWKTISLANGFRLMYNKELCQLSIMVSTSFPTSFTSFGYSVPNELRPVGNVVSPSGINADCLVMVTSFGDIQRRSMTGSHTTQNANCTLTWHY